MLLGVVAHVLEEGVHSDHLTPALLSERPDIFWLDETFFLFFFYISEIIIRVVSDLPDKVGHDTLFDMKHY